MPLSAFACDADSDATLRQLNRHKDATLLTPALAHRLPPAYRRQGANLTRKLMLLRQCGGKPQTHLGNTRTLYEHLVPNETHFHVDDEPAVAIRKFSPCGRYLVTFSKTPGVYSLVVFRLKRGTRSAEVRLVLQHPCLFLNFSTFAGTPGAAVAHVGALLRGALFDGHFPRRRAA